MKKIIKLLAVIILSVGVLAGCGNSNEEEKNDSTTAEKFGDLKLFSTVDMAGEEVTQDIFADYEVTMVNIWATWCNPCVEEMPALAKLKEQLPDNTNMITICQDAESEGELANTILNDSGATFQTLKTSETIDNSLMQNIQAFPTTIFVNSEGEIIGNVIEGVVRGGDDVIIEHYLQNLNNALEIVGESDE